MHALTRRFLSASLLIPALFALLSLAPLHAQVVGGTLSGIITDPTGAALSEAAVLIHNDETGNESEIGRASCRERVFVGV